MFMCSRRVYVLSILLLSVTALGVLVADDSVDDEPTVDLSHITPSEASPAIQHAVNTPMQHSEPTAVPVAKTPGPVQPQVLTDAAPLLAQSSQTVANNHEQGKPPSVVMLNGGTSISSSVPPMHNADDSSDSSAQLEAVQPPHMRATKLSASAGVQSANSPIATAAPQSVVDPTPALRDQREESPAAAYEKPPKILYVAKDPLKNKRTVVFLLGVAGLFSVPCLVLFMFFTFVKRGVRHHRLDSLTSLRKDIARLIKESDEGHAAATSLGIADLEETFNARRERLRDFFRNIGQQKHLSVPGHGSGNNETVDRKLVDLLRNFLMRWSGFFNDCSSDPQKAPYACLDNASERVLNNQVSVSGFCKSACQEIAKRPVKIMRELNQDRNMEVVTVLKYMVDVAGPMADSTITLPWSRSRSIQNSICNLQAGKYAEDKGCAKQSKILSSKGMQEETLPVDVGTLLLNDGVVPCGLGGLVAGIIMGTSLALLELAYGCHTGAVMLGVGVLCLTFTLARIDTIFMATRLDQQELVAVRLQRSLKDDVQALKRFHNNGARLVQLWNCRTLPRLDVAEAIGLKLSRGDWSVETCKSFLTVTNTALIALQKCDDDLGPWLEQPCLRATAAGLLRERLAYVAAAVAERTTNRLKAQLGGLLRATPRILMIRVCKATNVPRGTLLENYRHFVRLRPLGCGDWVRTTACDLPSKEPTWDKDYLFLLNGGRAMTDKGGVFIQLEVRDEGSDELIGEATAALMADDAGSESRMTVSLKSCREQSSSLVLDVFFSTSVRHLVPLQAPLPEVIVRQPESEDHGEELDVGLELEDCFPASSSNDKVKAKSPRKPKKAPQSVDSD
eukprot:TRINITY_DN54823_c0_g1_i1.p1 TRINITY_DN54823_c0_g1~~TRINITY_DN54823_c0_g1_i1.p1  ORF type:complete len:847 (-),score=144.74 TRINITY_DN54823_c0_g1_i1:104-2644(-)